MTDRESLDFGDLKLKILQKYGWTCEVCKKAVGHYGTPQLGHRISQSKMNLAMYGKSVIHHELNLAPCCCLKCNAAVLIDHNVEKREALLDRIYAALDSTNSNKTAT